MKITPWFTQSQAILGEYDFLPSEVYNRSYIKKCPGSSELYNGSEWGFDFEGQKTMSIHHKKCSTLLQGLTEAFWSEDMHLCKKNIHI